MGQFLGILGLMVLCWMIQDTIKSFSKAFDGPNSKFKFLVYPAAAIAYLCMLCSLPIGLFMMWHDSRMEKVHKQIFLEDHKEHIDTLNNIIDRLSPPKNKD